MPDLTVYKYTRKYREKTTVSNNDGNIIKMNYTNKNSFECAKKMLKRERERERVNIERIIDFLL